MNELLKLLFDNKISFTGGEHEERTVGIFTDTSDPTNTQPFKCSFKMLPEDNNMSVKEFTMMFARPAIISIKYARQRVKIESIREQAQEIRAACKLDNDLVVYEKVVSNLLEEINRWCSVPKKV